MGIRSRAAKLVGSWLFRSGIGTLLARDRLHVDVSDDLPPGAESALLLHRHLAELLDEPALRVAVMFGSLRPNRKPVLQLTLPSGAVIGYAKVAWNDLTLRLVRNEADNLRRWRDAPPRTFLVPTLLHEGRWRDLEIVIISAFEGSPFGGRGFRRWPPVEVLREIAERSGVERQPLRACALWSDILRRCEELQGGSRVRMLGLAERLDAASGALSVAVGSWHGDWAPWNMAWRGRRLFIWDWERARSGVPVGLDALHFAFQGALAASDRRPREAGRRTLPSAQPILEALGVDARRAAALLSLYLLELSLRFEEATQQGVLDQADPMRHAVFDVASSFVSGDAP
jgi:hypothetical protein